MKALLERVLDLQLEHSSLNTPAMQERGVLIRNSIPDWLRERETELRQSFNGFSWQLAVQGKDGTGPKSYVPWVRLYNPIFSPSAQLNWYVVYLFRPDGEGVAICLSHGSTRWDGSTFKPRSATEAAELMKWCRGLLGLEAQVVGMAEGIDLGAHGLAPAYETTTAFSKMYWRNAIPDADTLLRDCKEALGLLGRVYRQVELGRAPHSLLPEEVEAATKIEEIARPTSSFVRKTGQGLGLTPKERRLVEERAMEIASEWLDDNGFEWRDVHKNRSFDFLAHKDGTEYVVEVKGTTGSPSSIILTKNEVEVHRTKHPLNMLLLIHGIELTEDRQRASGGVVHCMHPWEIADTQLQPMSYRYLL
jgi:MrcB-like, N-terminal domain/Domain of unknown function (DUF3883)